jgi:ankyrin repeat protein
MGIARVLTRIGVLALGASSALAQAPGAAVTQSQSEMLLATLVGDLTKVKALLESGVGPDFVDPARKGLTPLSAALAKAHREMVDVLLQGKADVSFPDGRGLTPLMHAARVDAGLTARLLSAGADLKSRDHQGMSAVLWAVAGGHGATTLPVLFTSGADPNDRRKDGTTALMIAAKNDATDLIPILVKAGADLKAAGPEGMTALGVAVAANHESAVAALLQAGADPNQKMKGGLSALIMASAGGNPRVAEALLRGGADVHQKADDGRAALAVAQAKGDAAMVALLQGAGAK